MIFDDCLFATIIAGLGLALAYLRAEYVSHRELKAAERTKLILQCELHAHRLTLKKIHVPMAPLRNQHFLGKESALRSLIERSALLPGSQKSATM